MSARAAQTFSNPAGSSVPALVALGVTIVLWAAAFIGIRAALPVFGVTGLTVGRLLVASLALAVVAPRVGIRWPARADLPRIIASGVIGQTVYQLLLNAGERTVDAGTASLLVNTGPLFTAVLAWLVLGDRISGRVRIGMAVGFLGAATMALGQGAGLGVGLDASLILGAALCFACNIIWQKPLLARYSGVELTCYAVWAATVAALPFVPTIVSRLPAADAGDLVALVFLGVGPSAIGFVAWSYALARLDASIAANTLYLVPGVAILGGWLLLGEVPAAIAIGGGAIALIGVAISRSSPSRPATTPENPAS